MPDYTRDELCKVCQRVAFGEIQYLGLGHWRHDDCYAGSMNWLEAYPLMPKAQKTADTEALYIFLTSDNHKQKGCTDETQEA